MWQYHNQISLVDIQNLSIFPSAILSSVCTIYTGAWREERMKYLPLIPRGFYVVVFLSVWRGFFNSLYSPFPSLVTITAAPYLQLWAWTYSSLKSKQLLLFWFRTRDTGMQGGEVGGRLSFQSFWISVSPL